MLFVSLELMCSSQVTNPQEVFLSSFEECVGGMNVYIVNGYCEPAHKTFREDFGPQPNPLQMFFLEANSDLLQ